MHIKTFSSFDSEQAWLCKQILDLTQPMVEVYPRYTEWFKKKFMPAFKKKERLCVIAQDDDGCLVGTALFLPPSAIQKSRQNI